MSAPILCRWDGEAFKPAGPYWAKQADRDYCVGETYRLVTHEERSAASHNHYFAAINDAWQSMPDAMLADYPTAEHLRKKLLISCGYADERDFVCGSKAEAQRMREFIRPMDDYAVIIVRDDVVRVYTAKSQSKRAMGAKAFQESKTAVLDAIYALLGVERKAA